MQDQPSAIELIEAVQEFLEKRAMPALEGQAAFHARVASNALGIVKRELEIAPHANAEEKTRLEALLGEEGTLEELNRELCRRIASGGMTAATPGLAEHLRATTLTKLAIDQPKYSAYRRALELEKDA